MKKSILLLVLTSIISFNTKAQTPEFWGMTETGGTSGEGIIYKTDANGANQQVVYNWVKYEGKEPEGSLIQATNGKFYGMTPGGGTNDFGVIFEYDVATDTFIKILDFNGTNGKHPTGSLMQGANGKLYGMTTQGGTNDVGVLFEYTPTTNVYMKIIDFDQTNGAIPYGSLMEASNGKL